jgi:hypothetical protein
MRATVQKKETKKKMDFRKLFQSAHCTRNGYVCCLRLLYTYHFYFMLHMEYREGKAQNVHYLGRKWFERVKKEAGLLLWLVARL